MTSVLFDRLFNNKIIICVGSGGVGKTTVSASLAVAAAKSGKRVLVMTIDPSKRLKTALGLAPGHETSITRVPNQNYQGEMYALLLDAEAIFREFVTSSSTDPNLADRLLKNRLYRQLSTTLSGSQEFTSLLQLSKIADEKQTDERFDLIILDTPPAQHAIEFLEAPEKINALFQEKIVRWFIGEDMSGGIIQRMIATGTRTVFSALERITGSHFMRELNDFFASVRSVQTKISEKTQAVETLLHSKTTAFILVTGFDSAKLREAEELNAYLRSSGFHLDTVIINRAFVQNIEMVEPQVEALASEYEKWRKYHAGREKVYLEYAEKWRQNLSVIRVPDLNREVAGLAGLEGIADELSKNTF